MADVSTLTPEQRQAILLHLQGGGDPAHAGAVADGAITPAMAQQLAQAAPTSSASLLNPEQMRALAAAGQPADGSIPVSPEELAAAQAAMAAPAASAPVVAVDAHMPQPKTQLGAANIMTGNMATQGQALSQKGAQTLEDVKPLALQAGVEKQKAVTLKEAHDLKVGKLQKEVLDNTASELQTMQDEDKARYDQRQQRLDQMLNQMTDSANLAAQAAPHDFWADKSTPSRIFGIISQIAGGAANGLANQPGQPTPLDRVIQRDLDQQRLDFAQKSQSGNQAAGIYNDLIKATDSDIAASGAFKIAAYKKAIAQMQAALASDPEGAGAAALQEGIANAQQAMVDIFQSVGKTQADQGKDLQEKAAINQTGLAEEQMKGSAGIAQAHIAADAKLALADKTAKASGESFFPAGTYAIPGQEEKAAQGIPKRFQVPIFNSTTGLASLRKEVEAVRQIWTGNFPTGQKEKMLADHQQTIARDLTKVYNSGNRAGGGAYDEMAGEIPKTTTMKIVNHWTDDNVFSDATLAALSETLNSGEEYVDNELKPFGQSIHQPKAAQ